MATSRTYRIAGNVAAPTRRTDALLGDAPAAQFARFVLAGGVANLAYAGAFLLLAGLGAQTANALGAVVSAVLANELHRRLTFRAGAVVSWRTAQWQGGLTLAAGLVASSAALAWLESATAGTGPVVLMVVAAAVNGLVGLVRFLTLRRLFTTRRPAPLAPAARPRPPVVLPADRPVAALAA